MTVKRPLGLFVGGTDTGVGKTMSAVRIVEWLRRAGYRVAAHKPVATGCQRVAGECISDDALALWEATGRIGTPDKVCPQCFEAPLAPYLAAEKERRVVDSAMLRDGIKSWNGECDFLIVEGTGGLMSPLDRHTLNIDLAVEFGFPLVIVAQDRIGVIHQTLQSCTVASDYSVPVKAIILSETTPPDRNSGQGIDPSLESNATAVAEFTHKPVTRLPWRGATFVPPLDWATL